MATLEEAKRAQPLAYQKFGEFGDVVGVGIVRLPGGGYGLKINFSKQPRMAWALPSSIGSVPTQTDVIGQIKAYNFKAS